MTDKMKKAISIVAAMMAAVILFTGCQSTPEQPVVIGKDMEQMLEKAQDDTNGTKIADLNLPSENYTYFSQGSDERLKINIDAQIITPESDVMPMAKTQKTGFSQELVTQVFDYLFPEEKPYWNENSLPTKGELEEQILNLKRQIAEESYDTGEFTREDMQARLETLEKQYETAPETASEKTVSDGTMQPFSRETHLGVKEGLRLSVSDSAGNLFFVQSFGADSDVLNENMLSYSTPTSSAYTMSGAVPLDNSGNAMGTDGEQVGISYMDATAQCDSFLAAIGYDDVYALSEAYLVNDAGLASVDDGTAAGAAEHYAYQFYYSRKYLGTRVATNVNALSSFDESNAAAEPWSYESLVFLVDENGIARIDWRNPVEIVEPLTADAGLISFDSAMEIFQKMIDPKFVPVVKVADDTDDPLATKTLSLEIHVSEIALGLVNIRYQNNGAYGILTPAYLFVGHTVASNESSGEQFVSYDMSSDFPEQSAIIMAINAIDGSIINMNAGY